MRRYILLTTLFTGLIVSAWSISIYDIQYTAFPGSDNTYPSQYAGKSVSTEGIITAVNYKSGGFFISESVAGPFTGLLVLERRSDVQVGDRIRLSGVVQESFGMTTLQDITSLRILERNHPLPKPANLTTAQITHSVEAEAYESVYARVHSVSASGQKSTRNRLLVSDGTGMCTISLGNFGSTNINPTKSTGNQYSSITGIVTFSFGEFALNPVSGSDIEVHQPVSVQNRRWGKNKSIYK